MPINASGEEFAQWYKYQGRRNDAENYFKEWSSFQKPSMKMGHYFVCDSCKIIHYHSLSNCERCPGKLREVRGTWENLAVEFKDYHLGPY